MALIYLGNTLHRYVHDKCDPSGHHKFHFSEGWGGRTSDEYITEHWFLNNLLPGDVILADHGFDVTNNVAVDGASLDIPGLTKECEQLNAGKIEKTRNIANVRIHM